MPGQLQHALDGFGQPPRFGLNGRAVLLDARRLVDDAVGEVAGRGADDRDRRAQLVRDGRDELELLPRQPIGAARRHDDQADRRAEQRQNARAQTKLRVRAAADGGLERTGAMLGDEPPVTFRRRKVRVPSTVPSAVRLSRASMTLRPASVASR